MKALMQRRLSGGTKSIKHFITNRTGSQSDDIMRESQSSSCIRTWLCLCPQCLHRPGVVPLDGHTDEPDLSAELYVMMLQLWDHVPVFSGTHLLLWCFDIGCVVDSSSSFVASSGSQCFTESGLFNPDSVIFC